MLKLWALLVFTALAWAAPPKGGKNPRDQYLVSSLPGLYNNLKADEIPLMFAGQLLLYPENNTHYFFWKYVDNNKIPENNKRTIFWFNGGPGCSSMDGALLEAGPLRINKDEQVVYNAGSWHKAADIVFVDQPVGTGFSYGQNYVNELYELGWDFLTFLQKYYEVFPDDIDNEIYLAGESFAGQYIPYVARSILDHNKRVTESGSGTTYNLKSLLIGNGYVSPNEQGLSFVPFFHQAGLLTPENPQWDNILRQHERCQAVVNKIDANWDSGPHDYEINDGVCEQILSMILGATADHQGKSGEQCINMYDYTLRDSYPACGSNWPNELAFVTPFLRKERVMNNLNLIEHKSWHECSGSVGRYLTMKQSTPAVHLIPGLIEEVKVIFFNGNLDIICNYLGTESFLKKLHWGGETGFTENAINWIHDGKVAGYLKEGRNLTFVNVFNASHMVPYDLPEISRALIDIATGNFDTDEVDDPEGNVKQRNLFTYNLGERAERLKETPTEKPEEQPEEAPVEAPVETPVETSSTEEPIVDEPEVPTLPETTSEPSAESGSIPSGTRNSITRIIQLFVIGILIWGVYVLYTSYKARPSSIIKTGPSSGKKKNVQWADQLRRFQEDDEEFQQQKNQGFLSKTLNKWKGTDTNGKYAPVAGEYAENIELGEGVAHTSTEADFRIESDDEHPQEHPQEHPT